MRSVLVQFHQSAVACDIEREDGGKAARQALHPATPLRFCVVGSKVRPPCAVYQSKCSNARHTYVPPASTSTFCAHRPAWQPCSGRVVSRLSMPGEMALDSTTSPSAEVAQPFRGRWVQCPPPVRPGRTTGHKANSYTYPREQASHGGVRPDMSIARSGYAPFGEKSSDLGKGRNADSLNGRNLQGQPISCLRRCLALSGAAAAARGAAVGRYPRSPPRAPPPAPSPPPARHVCAR